MFEAMGSRRYSRPALYGIDAQLERILPRTGGTFLEAGAHDGYTQSNTYYLERFRGWSGILVEPIPELRRLCVRRRPGARVIAAALVGPDFQGAEVTLHFGDLMSAVGDAGHAAQGLSVVGRAAYQVSVPAKTLTAILEETSTSPIDLMVLDLEGHELQALRGLDLERLAPGHLLLEALEPDAQKPAFDRELGSRYEFVAELSPYDLLYRRRA
jgi:FkbM family methyltransferase